MSDCSAYKRLISAPSQAISKSMKPVEASSFPSVFKEGRLRSVKRFRSSAAQTGWLVNGRVASLYARVAILILFEITNPPVCAAEERDLFTEAQPPLLENGGEWTRLTTNPSPPPRVATCRTVLSRFMRLFIS